MRHHLLAEVKSA